MDEDRTKHLEMIQVVISRLGTNSFSLKASSVALSAAVLAIGREQASFGILWIALVPVFMFWYLDGYYLQRERLFRVLFDRVRIADVSVEPFEMSVDDLKGAGVSVLSCMMSKTLFIYYLGLVAAVGVVAWLVR